MTTDQRYDRQHPSGGSDPRPEGARDRDRLLYAAYFRRLAGVTQVVGAHEGHVFHNRLTHTLKVAQIARRLAEYHREPAQDLQLGSIDPDVVEAAALAHDLGHPPFGHIAESELNTLVRENGDGEGFEGNAQSFRIATRLEAHRPEYDGLNLTRATLNAILKHPAHRRERGGSNEDQAKFGVYDSDDEAFAFARGELPEGKLSVEAEIMDVADSIAYSVHDLDDFHRAGLIPVNELANDTYAFKSVIEAWKRAPKKPPANIDDHTEELGRLLRMYVERDSSQRFPDPWEQQGNLQYVSSFLINRYITDLKLTKEPDAKGRHLVSSQSMEIQMRFLQRLVWHYVIENPRLATQQHGQRRIIRTLFDVYYDAARRADMRMIPPLMHKEVQRINRLGEKTVTTPARVAADIVSSLTDAQAGVLYRRLTGAQTGSVVDLVGT